MSHPIRDLEERLSAYADGELPPEEAERLRVAIEGDPLAQAILKDHEALSLALRATLEEAGEKADFTGFVDGVMARVEAERAEASRPEEAPAPRRRLGWFRLRRAPIFAAAAAALAAVVVVGGPGLVDEPSSARMLLAGDPADATILSMTTSGDHGATLFKTSEGTTIIYLTGK